MSGGIDLYVAYGRGCLSDDEAFEIVDLAVIAEKHGVQIVVDILRRYRLAVEEVFVGVDVARCRLCCGDV